MATLSCRLQASQGQVNSNSCMILLSEPFFFNLSFSRIVIAVSSGGQHTVMIAKDKVEGEEEVNGAVNDKTIQEEPAVNGTAAEKMDEN